LDRKTDFLTDPAWRDPWLNHVRPIAPNSKVNRQIHGNRDLSHAALLIDKGLDFSHAAILLGGYTVELCAAIARTFNARASDVDVESYH